MNEKKYRVIVWTRQPVRKFRLVDAPMSNIREIQENMATGKMTTLESPLKSGALVLIPADNIAFMEFHEK